MSLSINYWPLTGLKRLQDKRYYEPLLRECLNNMPCFREKSGGGFCPPLSESNRECDAIGKNGYNIDFKCLISQEGAENAKVASPYMDDEIAPGVKIPGVKVWRPSKASQRGEKELEFPNVWGFLVDHDICLTNEYKFRLADGASTKDVRGLKDTIKNLNKMIATQKHILIFSPMDFSCSGDIADCIEDILSKRLEEGLSIVSEARSCWARDFDTYYAVLLNSNRINRIAVYDDNFLLIGSVEITMLDSWRKFRALDGSY